MEEDNVVRWRSSW